jgi:hypothetical protein
MGRVKVTLEEGEIKAFKNLSGYHCFTDLYHKDYNLNIESDFYFPADKKIVIPLPDPKKPVDDTILKPNPVYPFPISATLVRGLVSNTGPVVNALVSVVGKTIETITDERGEFVLYFKGIKKEDITIEIRKDGDTKAVNTTIEEGNDDFVKKPDSVNVSFRPQGEILCFLHITSRRFLASLEMTSCWDFLRDHQNINSFRKGGLKCQSIYHQGYM